MISLIIYDQSGQKTIQIIGKIRNFGTDIRPGRYSVYRSSDFTGSLTYCHCQHATINTTIILSPWSYRPWVTSSITLIKQVIRFLKKKRSFPHPAPSPFQPGGQALADKLPHAVDNGMDHSWMTVANTVHCQSSGHGIQRNYLPPCHTFRRQVTGVLEQNKLHPQSFMEFRSCSSF